MTGQSVLPFEAQPRLTDGVLDDVLGELAAGRGFVLRTHRDGAIEWMLGAASHRDDSITQAGVHKWDRPVRIDRQAGQLLP